MSRERRPPSALRAPSPASGRRARSGELDGSGEPLPSFSASGSTERGGARGKSGEPPTPSSASGSSERCGTQGRRGKAPFPSAFNESRKCPGALGGSGEPLLPFLASGSRPSLPFPAGGSKPSLPLAARGSKERSGVSELSGKPSLPSPACGRRCPEGADEGLPPPASPLAHRLGRLAVASLHAELACAPKPGLVTPFDCGSHTDMDAATFLRSLFALRGYFVAIAAAGAGGAPFAQLRRLGLAAEAAMLRATGGINTHRGAIFSLGLLAAQAARLHRRHGRPARGEAVCAAVREWRGALRAAPLDPHSPGQRMRARHGVQGVREQAAAGYPLLCEVALPRLRAARADGLAQEAALAHTLMHLVAVVDDLNLLHRGGRDGLRTAQGLARGFLADGGAYRSDWKPRLARIGERFVAARLSPGGSADLLACAWFLHRQEHGA